MIVTELNKYICWVCRSPITQQDVDNDEAHTYHAEGCGRRDMSPHIESVPDCANLAGCGEDVHAMCCPSCTGQAF